MPDTRMSDPQKSCLIRADNSIPASEPLIGEFVSEMERLVGKIQLSAFIISRNNTEIKRHDLNVSLADGRSWVQQLWFEPGDTEPFMTFAVASKWKLSEFGQLRRLRDEICVPLIFKYSVTRISCTWN